MPKDTLFEISNDTKDYFTTIIDKDSKNLPKLNGFDNNIFYIPKSLGDLSVDESLYKVEDVIQEEVAYKNYLQLKDGIYKIVDENGNVLK